uniref:Complement C1q-like protein 4 n=1 Tax=Crassostrea virginica TaxID=6565 RepID=A0A8B8AHK8_CRAVI|nr:complement C1q-like protein 4 [Crassostrea virginica]
MAPFVKFLLLFAVNQIIGVNSNAISLDKRANFAKRADKNTLYNIYTKINTLEKALKNQETRNQKRTKLLREVLKSFVGIDSNLESSQKVAFTATVTRGTISKNGQTLVFPNIITNVGGGYNRANGVFTAPRDGVYVFFCRITAATNPSDMYFDFILNGSRKAGSLVYGRNNNPYRTSSNSIVLQLRHGDRVWVKMTYGGNHYYYGVGGDQSFSGYLL